MRQEFKKVPIADVTAPQKTGVYQCYVDYWWAVTEDDCVLVYGSTKSRQCNSNKAIIDHMLTLDLYPATKAVQIPLVFFPHECEDYL